MSEGAVDTGTEPVQADLPDTGGTVTTPEPTPSSWRDGLSDDLRNHPELVNIPDTAGLAKMYVGQTELVGRKGVILPKEDDADDKARFYSELGRPDTADDYDLGDFAPGEGLPWSDTVQTSMMTAMHTAGLTNGQVNDVVRAYAESQGQEFEGLQERIAEATSEVEKGLRKEFGSSYDAKIDLANRAFAMAAGDKADEIRQIVMGDGTRLGDNLALVRMFARLGESLGEDSLRGGGASASFAKSPDQAKAELSTLAIDENFEKVLMDRNHPEHQRAVDRRAALFEQAYPNTEVAG